MNTPKLQPHTKQLSFRESDLKPAEHPLYNQHRERTTLRRAGAEKRGSSWDPLARYSQTEGSSQTGAFHLRSRRFWPYIRHSSPGAVLEEAAPCPHSLTPILEMKRVYDLEHWRTVGNGDSTLGDHGHRIACSLSQHIVSRLQSIWCSGQHLETMPSIGWGSQPAELLTGDSPKPIPPPKHTQTHREKPKLGSSQSFSSAPLPCDASPG